MASCLPASPSQLWWDGLSGETSSLTSITWVGKEERVGRHVFLQARSYDSNQLPALGCIITIFWGRGVPEDNFASPLTHDKATSNSPQSPREREAPLVGSNTRNHEL